MLFLPVVSAFAVTNTFNFTVTDAVSGSAVPGATVYVWDKNSPYTNSSALTAANGSVQVVLGDLQPVADNLTNPAPNIGILVMPNNAANSTRLAFAVEEMVFYNLSGTNAIAPNRPVALQEGCLVHVKPQTNDGTSVVAGVATQMRIFLPGVPMQVKMLIANSGDISVANPSLDIVWPYQSQINADLLPDTNWDKHTEPYFYNWHNQGIQVGSDAEMDFTVVHDRQSKGAILVDLGDNTIGNTAVRLLHYGYNQTIKYQGNVSVYLPKGIYNFNFALVNNDGTFTTAYDFGTSGPPPAVWTGVDLNTTSQAAPATREYVVTGGIALTVNFQLGAAAGDGDETALGNSRVEVLKKMTGNGFEQWEPVQSNPNSLYLDGAVSSTNASIQLFHRLDDGVYKLRVFDTANKPGVIDTVANPPKCFSYITSPEFTIANASTQGTLIKDLVLPQAAAVVANIAVNDLVNTNVQLLTPNVAYLKEYSLSRNDTFTWDDINKVLFVPFARIDKPIVIRADYDEDTYSSENPAIIKLWEPINATVGTTVVQNLLLNVASFTTINVDAKVGSVEVPNSLSTPARVYFSPLVPGTDIPGHEAFSVYEGLDNNVINKDLTGYIPSFKAEIGARYYVKVAEETSAANNWQFGLEGIVPFKQVFTVPTTPGFTHTCYVSEDRSFAGQIQLNGQPIGTDKQVLVKVQSIFDDNFYDSNYYFITRQQVVTGSFFRVSGIRAGRYEVLVSLENIDPEDKGAGYNIQTMPFIRREIFVGENSTTETSQPIVINLNPGAVGYVAGKIVDDIGNGVPGLNVAIHRRVEQDPMHADMGYSYYMRGPLAFLCTTDATGQLISAAANNQTYVPLETGEYDLFVDGIATAPTGFSYDLGEYANEAAPKFSFSVFPNNQVTPVMAKIMRRFPLSGTISEDGNPLAYANFQLLSQEGKPIGWGYTDASGKYEISGGVIPGEIQFGLVVAEGPNRRFYLHRYQMIAGQANVHNFNLDPNTLSPIRMVTKDSTGAVLPQAGGDLFLFSDPIKAFRAPHWYLTYIDSDAVGQMNLYAPALTTEQAGFTYGFRGFDAWKQRTVKDALNNDQIIYEVYTASGVVMLPVGQTTPVELVWLKPATVSINATNIPAGRENRYIGVLMPLDKFKAGPVAMTEQSTVATPGMTSTTGEQQERPLFSAYINGAFRFSNVKPGREYVFVAYEAFTPIYPEEAQWAMSFQWTALFRHLSVPFMVAADLQRNEAFGSLAGLTLTCTQDPTLITGVDKVKIGFTGNPTNTTGLLAWPVVAVPPQGPYMPPTDVSYIGFPLEVPASYALRIAYAPEAGSKYLGRVYENVVVPSTGRNFDIVLKELKSLYGTFKSAGGFDMDGQILLVRAGADFSNEDVEPIRLNVNAGSYNGYLPPDHYLGYAVPVMGAPKALDVVMPADADLELNIVAEPGVMVYGKIVGPNQEPIFDASLLVMRKPAARSDLLDGESFLPYPAMMGDNVVRCGPTGDFFFQVEDGVDYYLQAVVPLGFSPGAPVKLSVNGSTSVPAEGVVITIGEGGMIIGSTNVPAYIEAMPSGQNALLEQFGTISTVKAEAVIPDPISGRYNFKLRGLDANMIYDIVVYPTEPGKAVKKLTYVPVPTDPEAAPMAIDLFDGYRVVGQLVDVDGNPISARSVSVNLAMTLPAETTTTVAGSKFAVKQTTTVADPTTYTLQNSIEQGQWTMTDEYGQFVFENVPQFLVAFIKTDYGFSYENVDYGRARTPNFAPDFASSNLMEVNVVVPVGGKIVGRLIDENGQPVNMGFIEATLGQNWNSGIINPDGTFKIEGLSPAANYMINVDMVPGRVSVFRMGILVEPGKTTDLGSILVAKAVPVTGEIASISYIVNNAFAVGVPESSGLAMIAVDGNVAITDNDLLKGSFMQNVIGERDLFFDPFNPPTGNIPFELPARSGKANVGMLLFREDMSGVKTMVTWGWHPGLTIPTQDQLGTASYNLGATINCPVAFGTIDGTLKHAVDTTAVFDQQDAVIALYPVEKVGDATTYTLKSVPFPTALTSPVDGRWYIKNVPAGTYRIKVITAKYGTQFFNTVVTIGATPVSQALSLGTSVKKVYGKVVLKGGTTPVESAKVNLIMHKLLTNTDSAGNFAFYMPVGEFVTPGLEILKSGYESRRVLEFATASATGVLLTADLNLGTIELSNAVGRFEATVKSADGNVPLIGAEVAMVFKESETSTVWTVGETQVTDESGRVQFSTVPVGRDITFRARAFYHTPTLYELSAANNTGSVSDTITMNKANPKVFYTGMLTRNETDASKLDLKAIFDFNQVVTQSRLGLKIADQDRLADAQAVDAIGGRLTSLMFNSTVPNNVDPLIASVTYDTAADGNYVEIGKFNLLANALFMKEYEVDPLANDGFTGRQTDDSGNLLPAGISVPPGYLDPTIESFNLTVASPTAGTSVIEGTTTPPEFAGPAFEFTFDGSNFAGGSEHKGLFEITIAYEAGTSLEPRWYDTTNNRWSKVGIVDGSVQYDYPEKGYVTFKVDHLTQFAVLKNVEGAASGMRCDFNGDSIVDDRDIAALIARNQLAFAGVSADQITAANINTIAGGLLKSQIFTVTIVPNTSIDNLNGDGVLDDSDLAFLIGWIQMKNAGLTAAQITEAAVNSISSGLLGSLSGTLSKFPGETVSR